LTADRAAYARRPAAHALAQPPLAASPCPARRRVRAAHPRDIADLLTRELSPGEIVLSLDEMTSLQPRPRVAPTRPARPGRPAQVEHKYERKGASHVCAVFVS